MFANQIPQFPNFGRVHVTATKRHYCNDIEELFPQDHAQPQGWGLSFMLTLQPHPIGRGRNTAHWAGLPNLWWWCDRSKGVAGMVCTQILPSSDPKVNQLIADVESTVYRSLLG
jgi:hypothetical protein